MKRLSSFLFSVSALSFLLIPSSGLAQGPQSREDLGAEIRLLRATLADKEAKFLAPAPEDTAKYTDFLKQPDTGMCRLIPRESAGKLGTVRGNGAYYSFTRRSNDYDQQPQIGLEQGGYLSTGFYGADYGFLADLGDFSLDATTIDNPVVKFLASLITPSDEPGARAEQRLSSSGFVELEQSFKSRLPVHLNATYVLRAVGYREYDVVVAFQPVREDSDGSLIILWKLLKQFPVPQLLSRTDQ